MRGGLALIGLVLFSSNALADPTRDEVMSGAARCEGLADNRSWLDCFYGSAQPMRSLLGLSPAPASQTKLVPPVGASYMGPAAASMRPGAVRSAPAEKSRGFVADLLGSSRPIVSEVPMASYRFGRDGKFVVVLANGQTYRQEESDLVLAKWNRDPASYRVTIIGASDKFLLKVKGEPGISFHVRRM